MRAAKWGVGSVCALLLATLGAASAQAQTAQSVATRLAGDWSSTAPVMLIRTGPPKRLSGTDAGEALANTQLNRMLLLLQPSDSQTQALTVELAHLEDPASSEYHHWLTPAQFADAYSNSVPDVAAVADWLTSQGFQVAPISAGRGWIEFSGTVAQVEQAFHAQVHSYSTLSGTRFVLMNSISVPGALAPLVQGLVSLDGAVSAPALTTPQPMTVSASDLAAQTALSGAVALTPSLAAQLLHTDTLESSGITGSGESIAIATRSNVNSADVEAFRAAFGLPASSLTVVPAGTDPGLTDAQAEATMAVSWAGAAAPSAQILLVPAASTAATDGVDLSLAAIVDRDLAQTIVVGYSSCEAVLSTNHQAFYAALYRQASAEGIAVIAAAGDSGSAACHVAGSSTPVTSGYSVNALAATPWDTAVGVASFDSLGRSASSTALSAWSPVDPADPGYAGGGGASTLYTAPGWQPVQSATANSTGVHDRLMPDLALPTAIDTGVNPGLAFCLSNSSASTGCTLVHSGGSAGAAALFAGIAALVEQQNGMQGNLAPNLYALSSRSGVFSDVQQGTTQLKCAVDSPGCGTTGEIGYSATTGYDLATGLGVVNAGALVKQWAQPMATGTGSVTVTNTIVPSQTINPSGSVVLSATVASLIGGGAPTGTVAFYDQTTATAITTVTLTVGTGSSQVSTASVTVTGVLAQGGHPIVAEYSGDSTYAAANSQPVVVEVQPSATVTVVTPATSTPAPGSSLTVTATITSSNAGAGALAPSGTMDFRMDGVSQGIKAVVAGTSAAPSTNSTSSVTMTVPTTAGTHQIVGFYSGDSNYNNSTSTAATITVTASTPTVTLTPATTTPTAGSSLLLTITITPPTSGATPPTGTVTIKEDGTAVGTATVTSGTPSSATLTLPLVSAGTHLLQAVYSGDTVYATANSATVSIVASKGTTTTTVTASPTALTAGETETLTATVAPANPTTGVTYTLTGSVSFYDGGSTLLGTAVVSNNTATLPGVSLANNVNHTITAIYTGDTNWLASTSAPLLLAATTLPDTVVLTSNYTTAPPGAAIVLTATVTPATTPSATAESNPTGQVVFYNGTTVLGTAPLVAVTPGNSSVATLTTQTLPGGQDTVYAFYQGDLYFDAATSNLLTLTVQDFTLTAASTNPATNLNIVQGSSGSASFVVTGLGGFNNQVQVVCQVPTQDNMTCTASPQQVTPTAAVTFVVQTYKSGAPGTSTAAVDRGGPRPWSRAMGSAALAVLGFVVLPFGWRSRKRLLVLVLLLAGVAGSSIGCTSSNAIPSTGTPLGVATLKIVATAYVDNTVVNRSTYLTVNVLAPGSTP